MDKSDLAIVASTDRVASPGGGNGGGSLSDWVAILETELKHLATRAWILGCLLFVIVSVVSTAGAGVWYLSRRLAAIETKLIAVEASFDSYKESHNREHDREDSQ